MPSMMTFHQCCIATLLVLLQQCYLAPFLSSFSLRDGSCRASHQSIKVLSQLCMSTAHHHHWSVSVQDAPTLSHAASSSFSSNHEQGNTYNITPRMEEMQEQESSRVRKNRKAETTQQSSRKILWPNSSNNNNNQLRQPPETFTLSYSSAIQALRVYYSMHGNLVIPRRYTIPQGSAEYPVETHNVDLASTVYNMKWWQRNVRCHTARVAELNQIGFLWERLQPEWNLVLEALITYNTLYGNLLVPSSFVVPSSSTTATTTTAAGDWPSATWSIPLGRCVQSIRSRQDFIRGRPDRLAQLIAMGFVWDVSEYQFRKCFRAIEYYAKRVATLGGRKKVLRIPSTFVVPSRQGWPEELWDYPLGAKCCAIRQKGLFVKNKPERIAALEEIGFQWSGNAALGWLEVVHAAAIYSQIHGRQLDVPQNFIVPSPTRINHINSVVSPIFGGISSNEAWPWPEKLWGLKLGIRLKDIRLKGLYLKGKSANARRMQLDALGFVWKPKRGPR